MNLSMVRGDTRTFTITVTNPDGTPFNLAGSTVWFSVRPYFGAPSYIFQKKTGQGVTFPDAANGIAEVLVDHDDTAALPSSEQIYQWDAQIATTDNRVITLQWGKFIIQPDVTTEVA